MDHSLIPSHSLLSTSKFNDSPHLCRSMTKSQQLVQLARRSLIAWCALEPSSLRRLLLVWWAGGHVGTRTTVDGCEILHHQKDGWNPRNRGINHLSTRAGFLPSTVWTARLCVSVWSSVWHRGSRPDVLSGVVDERSKVDKVASLRSYLFCSIDPIEPDWLEGTWELEEFYFCVSLSVSLEDTAHSERMESQISEERLQSEFEKIVVINSFIFLSRKCHIYVTMYFYVKYRFWRMCARITDVW